MPLRDFSPGQWKRLLPLIKRRAPPRARVVPDTSSRPCSPIWAVWRRQVTLRYHTWAEKKNYVCRKSPECSRRCDEGTGRADEFLLFMGEFLAHSWSISSCARGSILLLLIISWRLNFRLMVAAFIAEREKKNSNSVWFRTAWLRCVSWKWRRAGRVAPSDTQQKVAV